MQSIHNLCAFLLNRLSKLLETQERERLDAHEDLCDKYRPSKIVLLFKDLYKKEYVDISDALDRYWPEKNVCIFLLDVFQVSDKMDPYITVLHYLFYLRK